MFLVVRSHQFDRIIEIMSEVRLHKKTLELWSRPGSSVVEQRTRNA